MCRVVCAVSWATWPLFTGVFASRVVLCARCPRPLGPCSLLCSLGVFCCVLRVRCPRPLGSCSPVCALVSLCCLCGESLRGAHSSIRTAVFRIQPGLGNLRVCTPPSGRGLFGSRQGLGSLPGAHSSIPTVAVVAWHLPSCLGCGQRRASLACLLAPRSAVCLVRCRRSQCSGRLLPMPWCLSPARGLSPPDLLGGCAGHVDAGRERGSWLEPQAPAEAGALGSLRVVPVRGPATGFSLAGPCGVGLGLRALWWFASVAPPGCGCPFLVRLQPHLTSPCLFYMVAASGGNESSPQSVPLAPPVSPHGRELQPGSLGARPAVGSLQSLPSRFQLRPVTL